MGAKRKKSAENMLERIRGKEANNNDATSHDLSRQISDDQLDVQLTNGNMIPTLSDGNLNPFSSVNEATSKRRKEEPMLVTIKDTSTGETTIKRMIPDHVWNLKNGKKVIVQLDGHGQGSDNGANLLVRFLEKLSRKSTFCPISVERWDRMPEDKTRLQWKIVENQSLQNVRNRKNLKVPHAGGSKSNARRARQMEKTLGRPVCRAEVVLSTLIKKNGNYVNEEGKTLADKIKENLPQDQEEAVTQGVSLKVLAHANDAIGKALGPEHSGHTRGLSGRVCPSAAFGTLRSSIANVSFGGSSNNISQPSVEDLEKEVETLKEKLVGYEETKEKLAQNQNHLVVLHKFLQDKFGSELPTLD